MIDYFKYTTGSAFTLSGSDFTGLFNVIDGVAWAGKSFSSTSVQLSSKDTFLANCFLAQIEFDRTATTVSESDVLTEPEVSPRNVIDQVFIDTNLGILNTNNLNLYALNIIANSSLLNFRDTAKDGNAFFLGLSSGKNDLRNDDVSPPKNNLFPIQIDPFSFVDKIPGLDVLDDTVDSTLFVYDDSSYRYFITTSDTRSYTFSGSFMKDGSITRLNYENNIFGQNSQFTYDNDTDTLYSLIKNGENNFTLKVYDNSFVEPCKKLKLVDQIHILEPVIGDVIQIGNELKGYRYMEEAGGGAVGPDQCYAPGDKISIRLSNKYSNTPVGTITPGDTGEIIVAFDIRDTDDSILVLTLPAGINEDGSSNMVGDVYNLYHIDAENITNLSSDLNPKEVQRFEETTSFPGKECEVAIYFSKHDSNMFTLVDEGFISTRFISNPYNVAGFASVDDLMYLSTMYFNSTNERFDLIQKKFNSNTLRSNYFNYINFIVANNSTDLFYFLHTIGRIYLFKGGNNYNNFVPLDLNHAYEKITSCESSLGISLNSEIQNIIEDTVNIFLNLSIIPISDEGIIPVLSQYRTYDGVDVNFRNFEFHENEEVTYSVISRVFKELYALQKAVFDSIKQVPGEDTP